MEAVKLDLEVAELLDEQDPLRTWLTHYARMRIIGIGMSETRDRYDRVVKTMIASQAAVVVTSAITIGMACYYGLQHASGVDWLPYLGLIAIVGAAGLMNASQLRDTLKRRGPYARGFDDMSARSVGPYVTRLRKDLKAPEIQGYKNE
ncbi:hypothetical protein AXK61_12655 [Tsukamurella pseudospumae]|uniref:SMODS and SLOG-associating 2TM effector domain-containing protein n=2 Tax=Tsukamurella pseudospumae TaxID=239498 RepID=A0A137ZRP5_9ACTN|nr:hypothetical protein AXK61_12655 [Tsukamurella pseudospumae]